MPKASLSKPDKEISEGEIITAPDYFWSLGHLEEEDGRIPTHPRRWNLWEGTVHHLKRIRARIYTIITAENHVIEYRTQVIESTGGGVLKAQRDIDTLEHAKEWAEEEAIGQAAIGQEVIKVIRTHTKEWAQVAK